MCVRSACGARTFSREILSVLGLDRAAHHIDGGGAPERDSINRSVRVYASEQLIIVKRVRDGWYMCVQRASVGRCVTCVMALVVFSGPGCVEFTYR